MKTTPLVSLQAPKDVDLEYIDRELREIWQTYSGVGDGLAATRASTFSFLVYEPEATQPLLASLGFYTGPVDGIGGPRTTSAIKAAQKAYKLEVTGISTPELLTRLKAEFDVKQAKGKIDLAELANLRQYSPDIEGAGMADAIASINPCRIITLCPTTGEDEGVKAQVSAYCPVNKRSANSLICCEYITITGVSSAFERVGGVLSELMIPDLPKFIWWKAGIDEDYPLFQRLVAECDRLIVDSSIFSQPEEELFKIGKLLEQDLPLIDLNWARISPWQELTAEAFDPPERRNSILEVDQVTIDYEKGNPSQALMYLGWLASRLNWQPVEYSYEEGDYNITTVKLINLEGKDIKVELAGVPIADWGEVLGDLISLKLTSTNLNADCCTVLCSETTGCMRMEAGGGGQSCRIQQVTSLADQSTETLLSQQLQRWGKDVLYQESMVITTQILKLVKN
ncbi:MAG: glucose-6-phosphate dehydrogenase assembly protein OpcA [Cyanobacteria bacterium]|nr:glucose-6-phosphate dehydrogenase assembly protein OpcA [Cyanobacteria bacterium CG_2015-16_32_12]NCO78054.1 glucose-6-phosphate dehydrogenase assembly protein OpcA [Cyanobacteria bacterium CG_2015-22_32_23]NCQ05356.1 glucose-6-phosphate dehydrogenase assembly protein OpcA [Cyanobacteria bacterium CG_2015-09_32_10]NCS83723.1 glucose-6-phosphate dehydrogenase assembly protein OpcA [Cyanobacteria bacterium CG_2015-02_32_10]